MPSHPSGSDARALFERAMDRSRRGDLDTAAELFGGASDWGARPGCVPPGVPVQGRDQFVEAEVQNRRALAAGLPRWTRRS